MIINRKLARTFSIFLVFTLVFGNFTLPVFAEEAAPESVENISQEITVPEETSTISTEEEHDEEHIEVETPEIVAEAVVETIPQTEVVEEEIAMDEAPLEVVEEIEGDYVEGEILVKYEDDFAVVEIEAGETIEEAIAELENNPGVEYAQPNFLYYPAEINTNDTHKDLLWGLEKINAQNAWAVNEGTNKEIIVAVIDTGVDYSHPDLDGNMWDGTNCVDQNGAALGGCMHGYDFADLDKNPIPTLSSHGTHVAGIIGAEKNNSEGVVGVAPHVKIMALKVDQSNGSFSTSGIVAAIKFAEANGVKIINASWGAYTDNADLFDTALRDSISAFPGLFVAAAGNGFCTPPHTLLECSAHPEFVVYDNDGTYKFYPASFNFDNIISVAATNQNDGLASFSGFGTTSVDVGAPGTNIYSTITGNYGYNEGTSMATPYVVGLAALLMGFEDGLSVAQVKNAILENGDPVAALSGKTVTGKRINAFNTLNQFVIVTPPPAPDVTAPVITLNGINPMTLTAGDTFTDPGATALDDVDGVVSVVASGAVDTSVAGTYTITYTAEDAALNISTATRIVNVNAAVVTPPPPSSTHKGGGGGGGSKKKTPPSDPLVIMPATNIPAGCVSGVLFSPTTGQKCPTVTGAIPGCSTGILFSPLTGEKCGQVLGASTSLFQFTLLLKLGSKGPEVLELQKLLNAKGYVCGTPDGSFGGKTKLCVALFQTANGLLGDGVVGAMTRVFLNK